MFAAIYVSLFLVYVYVLHNKITHGPDPIEVPPETTETRGLVEAAARLANPAGYSLSDTREDDSISDLERRDR